MRSLCSWFYRFPPISSLHTSAFPFHFWENHRAVLLRWTVSAPLGSMEGSVEERLQRLEMRAEIALKNKSDAGVCSPKQRASSQQASSQQPAASSQRAASEQQAASSEQRAASSGSRHVRRWASPLLVVPLSCSSDHRSPLTGTSRCAATSTTTRTGSRASLAPSSSCPPPASARPPAPSSTSCRRRRKRPRRSMRRRARRISPSPRV